MPPPTWPCHLSKFVVSGRLLKRKLPNWDDPSTATQSSPHGSGQLVLRRSCLCHFPSKSMRHPLFWLVGDHFHFFHSVGNVIIPTDELIFFRGVGLNHQPDDYPWYLSLHHISIMLCSHMLPTCFPYFPYFRIVSPIFSYFHCIQKQTRFLGLRSLRSSRSWVDSLEQIGNSWETWRGGWVVGQRIVTSDV